MARKNVFDFSLGNPNVSPPDRFKELLVEVAGECGCTPGAHVYMPNVGYERTRAEIASYLTGVHSVALSSDHVIMTCGAGGALNVVFKALLDPGMKSSYQSRFLLSTPFILIIMAAFPY